MEHNMTVGTHCFPQSRSFAAPGPVWPEQVGIKAVTSAAAPSGRPVYHARFCTPLNPIGIDLPATHRMRMSAPEP